MDVVLVAARDLVGRLRAHLMRSEGEQAAFLLAEHRAGHLHQLRLAEMWAVPDEEFEYRGRYHLSLSDGVRPKVIKWAWDRGACLVEAHSHLDGMVAFSPSDMAGLAEFVPHVWWRLGGRPYAALVFAAGGFDALAWIEDPHQPARVRGLLLDGTRRMVRPTGLSYAALQRRAR